MELTIKKSSHSDKTPMNLLLQADPSEEMINKYLYAGDTYLAKINDEVIAVFVLMPNNPQEMELKNISIEKNYQGKGYGKEIIKYVIRISKMEGFEYLIVKTADTSTNAINFYKKMKFEDYFIVKGHFIKYYDKPVIENGKQAMDQIVLRKKL